MAEIPIQRKTGAGIWPWLLGLLLLLILLWFFFWRNHGNATTAAATSADTTVMATSTTTLTTVPGAAATGVTGAAGAVADTAPGTMAGTGGASANAAGGTNTPGMNTPGTNTPGTNTPGTNTPGTNAPGMSAAVGDYTRFVAVVDPNMDEGKQHAYAAGGLRRLADALASLGASGAPIANMRSQAAALQNSSPNSTHHAGMARSGFASAADAFDSLKGKYPSLDVARIRTAADAMNTGPHLLGQKANVQAFFEMARTALQGMTGAPAHS